MEYMIAIFMLLMQAALTGAPNPTQTVQGNIDYRANYIQNGVLPGHEKPAPKNKAGKCQSR